MCAHRVFVQEIMTCTCTLCMFGGVWFSPEVMRLFRVVGFLAMRYIVPVIAEVEVVLSRTPRC